MTISVVVNTFNEEENIERCLASVKELADEIIIVDMESSDRTREFALNYTHKIFIHPKVGFVEPARNFAIEKATGDWILILDADEVIPQTLALALKKMTETEEYNFIRIPRKNTIFGKWMQHSGFWPDYLIRFFKKGTVTWTEKIHGVPITRGKGFNLEDREENAINHYHYQTINQFIERLNRYTDHEARQLVDKGYKFFWPDLISKPFNEFLGRFFAREGYKDGIHGLALSFLQSISFLVAYLKVWEKEKFPKEEVSLGKMTKEMRKAEKDFNFWFWQKKAGEANSWKRFVYKLAARFRL